MRMVFSFYVSAYLSSLCFSIFFPLIDLFFFDEWNHKHKFNPEMTSKHSANDVHSIVEPDQILWVIWHIFHENVVYSL